MTGAARAAGGHGQGLVRLETSDEDIVVAESKACQRRANRLRRTILTSARLMVDCWRGSRPQWWMVTLTYAPDVQPAPRQVSATMKSFRDWCKARRIPCRYLWVLEPTKAGRPHYHVLVQIPQRSTLPQFDRKGWWRHGFTRTERAVRAVGYVAKYASKAAGRVVGGASLRTYGVCGLLAHDRAVLSFWRAPRWVRAAFKFCDAFGSLPETEVHQPLRRVRGGWCWQQTGEVVTSPWLAIFERGQVNFYLKSEVQAMCP